MWERNLVAKVLLAVSVCIALQGAPCYGSSLDDSKITSITDVRVLERNGLLNIMTSSKDTFKVWQAPKNSVSRKWQLARTWHNFVRLSTIVIGNGHYALIVTKDGGELYDIGHWDSPKLSNKDGLLSTVESVWRILPPEGSSDFSGIAVNLGSDSPGSKEGKWALFSLNTDETWGPMKLGSSSNLFTGFLRLAPGVIAVRGLNQDGSTENTKTWRLFQADPQRGWLPLKLVSDPLQISDVQSFAYPNGISIQFQDAQLISNWLWFYRSAEGHWKNIQSVVRGAPQNITDIQGYGQDHFLAIRSKQSLDKDVGGYTWRYYFLDLDQQWKLLSTILDGASDELFAIKTFGDRGIGFQTLNAETGRHGANWSAGYLNENNKWVPMQNLLDRRVEKIWDIRTFGQNRGVGFQSSEDSSNGIHAYEWEWLLKQGDTWMPLEKLLPFPDHIWDAYGENPDLGIAIEVDGDPAKSDKAFKWFWFLPDAAHDWVEISQVLVLPRGFPNRAYPGSVDFPDRDDANLRNGVLGIWGESGDSCWFLRSDSAWISINDLVLESSQ